MLGILNNYEKDPRILSRAVRGVDGDGNTTTITRDANGNDQWKQAKMVLGLHVLLLRSVFGHIR